MDDLTLEEWKAECDVFDSDIYEAISLGTCVEQRTTKGAPGAMSEEIAASLRFIDEARNSLIGK